MKKLMIAALALVFTGSAHAIDFEPEEGVTLQLNAGMSISNITNFKVDGDDLGGAKVGATIGAKLEYMLPNAMGTYVNAGIDWTMKGCSKSDTESFGTNGKLNTKSTATLHYLQIPIHVGYRYNLMENLGVYAEFGPYFAMGINAHHGYSIDVDGNWKNEIEDMFSYNMFSEQKGDLEYAPYFQIWDFGLGYRIGAEYDNHYSLSLGMDWGISDMLRDKYRDKMADAAMPLGKPHNFCTYITLGYRF